MGDSSESPEGFRKLCLCERSIAELEFLPELLAIS